jgi:hypothetical protein
MSIERITQKHTDALWLERSTISARDLVLKKIAISIIALLNFAAVGTGVYYLVAYIPIPAQALLVSPFIVGVLGALANIKFPTLGISSHNYTSYVNPLGLLGRVTGYLFFGPLMYVANRTDWTPYHDPIYANTLSTNLEEASFADIADNYGRHFSNLTRYGFIDERYKQKLKRLYKSYKPQRDGLRFYTGEKERLIKVAEESKSATEESASDTDDTTSEYEEQIDIALRKVNRRLEKLERKWEKIKQNCRFPHPKFPKLKFSDRTTRVNLKVRSCLWFGGNPFELAGELKA